MRAKQQFLWTAMITPFTTDGSKVDYATLATLLGRQETAGNGILMLGSTGESLSLSEEEKQEIIRFTLLKKLNVPVMVGVPNTNLSQTLDWMEFCRGQGVDAYLAATPAYTKPGAHGQIEWFSRVLDAADAPVMLYNVPSRTGVTLSAEVMRALHKHKNFWAVKESSGALEMSVDYTSAAPNIALYCGDDNMLASSAPLGACGLVSVASNTWADASHAYVDACRAGTYRGHEWWNASKTLFTTASPVPLKALMHQQGLLPNKTVRLPLNSADLASLDGLKAADKLITEWHHQIKSRRKEQAA